jgi:hypothetical protein
MVFGCRTNPAAPAEAQHENKLRYLEQECDRLRERLRVLEQEQMQDVTHVAGSSTPEVQGTSCFRSSDSLLVQKWRGKLGGMEAHQSQTSSSDFCLFQKNLFTRMQDKSNQRWPPKYKTTAKKNIILLIPYS